MPDFDPNAFSDMMDQYIEVADSEIKNEYESELNRLNGLTEDKLAQFGGTTSQRDEIVAELNRAKEENLRQSELIANLKNLGQSTYTLAQKVSALIP